MSGQRKAELPDALHHHLGHLVGAIGVEVCVVGQRLLLSGERVGGVVHQRPCAALIAEGLEEGAGHVVQLDDGHLLALGHGPHGVGIVAVGLKDVLVGVVEKAALCGGAEHHDAALLAHTVYEHLEVMAEVVPSAGSGVALLLVVVAKLAEHVVATAQVGHDVVEAPLGQERAGGQSALGQVAHGHALVPPAWNHLAP